MEYMEFGRVYHIYILYKNESEKTLMRKSLQDALRYVALLDKDELVKIDYIAIRDFETFSFNGGERIEKERGANTWLFTATDLGVDL